VSATIEILEKLIGFPSVSANSNLDIIGYTEAFLSERGFAVTRLPDESGQKAGLYAEKGPAGRGVLLSAHTDVVPVTGQVWATDPFRLSRLGDRLHGRGTTDMKGYLASALALADRAARAELKEPLKLALSYDEEVGCVGIRQMLGPLSTLIGKPRACIVGEPTEMQVAIGHKGKAALRATCHGQSGHSALAPRFLNALHLATDFVQQLRQLQQDLADTGARDPAYDIPYSTVHVGKLSGGTALNIVPSTAVVEFEYRYLTADNADDILERISHAAQRVAAEYRGRFPAAAIEVEQYNAYPGLAVADGAPVVGYANGLARSTGVTKVAFGTEAGFFHQLGIPTVVCGPGSMAEQGHQPDEYITVEQLANCDAMMDRLLADLTGNLAPR
jgi:acetylornithine deacetylase